MRHVAFGAALAFCTIGIAGCSSPLRVIDSPYESNVVVVGREQTKGWTTKTTAKLMTQIDRASGKPVRTIMYVRIWYSLGSWRFYERATLLGGQPLQVQVLDRDTSLCTSDGCAHEEKLAISLPFDAVRKFLQTGNTLALRIVGSKSGAEIVRLAPDYLAEFVAKVDQVSSRLAGGQTATQKRSG